MEGGNLGLQIRPLSYALGAEITGIDIRKPLDEATIKAVYDAFLKYAILMFPGHPKQPMTPAQHVAFGRQFGELDQNENVRRNRLEGLPEILRSRPAPDPNSKITDSERPGGMNKYAGLEWHSDRAFKTVPTKASLLHAVEIPSVGGDTMFANMYLAYESLSDGMKKLIADLYAIEPGSGNYIDYSSPERIAETKKIAKLVAQPIVRVHPDTGRKALYMTSKVKQFVGMTREESLPIIQYLVRNAERPQHVYRHKWHLDDLVMWDNRCTWHRAVADYDKSEFRCMDKVALSGTPSGGYVYDPDAAAPVSRV